MWKLNEYNCKITMWIVFVSIFRGDCNRRTHKNAIAVCRMLRFRYIAEVFGRRRR